VVCLRPRDPGESVGPRPLSAVVVRPLNFAVRLPQCRTPHFVSASSLMSLALLVLWASPCLDFCWRKSC